MPILGPAVGHPGWINACGFSGHGVMQAPPFGQVFAEQITDGVATSVDVSRLTLDRFSDPNHVPPS